MRTSNDSLHDSSLHLAAVHRLERMDEGQKGLQTPLVWELIYRAGSPTERGGVALRRVAVAGRQRSGAQRSS